jgi:hypothetical protein
MAGFGWPPRTPSLCALLARTSEVQIPVVRDPNYWQRGSIRAAPGNSGGLFRNLPPFTLPGLVGRYVHFLFLPIEICA